ncbi:DUF3592 domain-containing protein [Streptomyces sp. NBC_00582]|uniref:DUF3592 domain-containing protein n=1 Tax=Streptomyces sp. NBC_00582 TaxID=2975783 RepID=UPI0010D01B08|nr:DUF3592 domain-containing protein [Streptomyces sp. NBC_00582]WUB59001.1 DUF3592 domain-containing protein [Streptomyces sp. NBC_00582]WUB67726.1 DUF3592 domain-containing protein [Streptomyces sp. NBC_00582]
MSGNAVLLLLAAAFGAWALVQAVWYATGFTSDPVEYSVDSRVVQVDVPPPDTDHRHGLPVAVAFQDPSNGQELTLRTADGKNGALYAAWEGMPVWVRFPSGEPSAFRVQTRPVSLGQQLVGALSAAVLCAAVLLVRFTTVQHHSYGWALLGFGYGLTVLLACACVGAVRRQGRRRALLDGAPTVTAEVVSLMREAHHNEEITTYTYTAVLAFTTHEGLTVTGIGPAGLTRHDDIPVGTRLSVRYSPEDPTTFDFAPPRGPDPHRTVIAWIAVTIAWGAIVTLFGIHAVI